MITWLRAAPAYSDLVQDAEGCRTLRQLVADMAVSDACAEAWDMLLAALAAYPGKRPDEFPADLFKGSVPSPVLRQALIDWAAGRELTRRPGAELEGWTVAVRYYWATDPELAEELIDLGDFTAWETCKLYGERG